MAGEEKSDEKVASNNAPFQVQVEYLKKVCF